MATTMSFARAFSTRRKGPEIDLSTPTSPTYVGRAASQRNGRPVYRMHISSPTALISTSNGQVNYAQSIMGTTPIEIRHVSSGSSSSSSSEDSDTSAHSMETITDASSIEESPTSAEPEPNHLTSYFKPAVDTHKRSPSRTQSLNDSARPSLDTPRIPERAPSHSKRAHEGLHRKRSIQRMLSPPPPRERDVVRDSAQIFNPSQATFVEAAPKDNPFGKELAQLEEVAEEYGHVVRDAEAAADAVFLESHGLAHFSASDYMFEIQGLIHGMFADEKPKMRDLGGFF